MHGHRSAYSSANWRSQRGKLEKVHGEVWPNVERMHRWCVRHCGSASAKLAEFILRNTDDFSRVQFGRSMLNLLILDPVVSVFKAAKK